MTMRLSLIVAALGFGAAASFVPGCLIPDYCIVTFDAGQDWCRYLEGALMWPAGQPDLAEPIFADDQDLPKGCRCMNDAEHMVMIDQSPEAQYIELVGELAIETRMQCASLVPEGFEHNCLTLDGPQASSLNDPFAESKSNECIGSCSFGNPPPFGECPEADPYTCNGEPTPGGEDEVGPEDTGTDEGPILTDLPRAP